MSVNPVSKIFNWGTPRSQTPQKSNNIEDISCKVRNGKESLKSNTLNEQDKAALKEIGKGVLLAIGVALLIGAMFGIAAVTGTGICAALIALGAPKAVGITFGAIGGGLTFGFMIEIWEKVATKLEEVYKPAPPKRNPPFWQFWKA